VSTGTYTPRAGSIASRAIDALLAWGPLRTAELADKLDVSPSSLATNLAWPQRQGALVTRMDSEPGGRPTLVWSLPGTVSAEPADTTSPAPAVRNAFDLAPKLRTQPLAEKPDNPPKDAEAAQAPACDEGERATPNDGALPAEDAGKVMGFDFAGTRTFCAPPGRAAIQDNLHRELERMVRANQEAKITRFALWDDGALELRHGGQALVLPPMETRRLLDYLERMAVVEEGA
jgi:hypothetical protein